MTTGTDRRRHIIGLIAAAVCKNRQANYGDAEDNFQNIAELWTWWLQKRGLLASSARITAADVAQLQGMIKIARKLGNISYLDNWVDDAGYSVCGAGIVLAEELQKPHESTEEPQNPV